MVETSDNPSRNITKKYTQLEVTVPGISPRVGLYLRTTQFNRQSRLFIRVSCTQINIIKIHDYNLRDWNPNPEKERTDLLCGKLTWQDWKIGHFHIFHFTPSKGFFVTGEFSLPKMCLDADVFEG